MCHCGSPRAGAVAYDDCGVVGTAGCLFYLCLYLWCSTSEPFSCTYLASSVKGISVYDTLHNCMEDAGPPLRCWRTGFASF